MSYTNYLFTKDLYISELKNSVYNLLDLINGKATS